MFSIVSFNICGTIIMTILLISIADTKRAKDRSNRILTMIMVFTIISCVSEIFCNILDNYANPSSLGRLLELIFNYAYFIFHSAIMPIFVRYVYASADLWHKYKKYRLMNIIWWCLLSADMVVIAMNGWAVDMFSVDENMNYHRGPWLIIVYIVAAILGAWSIGVILKYRKIIRKDKFVVLLIMHVIVILGVVFQFLLKGISVENFSIVVAFSLYILAVKREENQIDNVTGAIVYNVGLERIANSFLTDKPVTIIFVKIVNQMNIRLYLGQELYDKFLGRKSKDMSNIILENQYGADLYYMDYGLFAIYSDDLNLVKAKTVADRFAENFAEPVTVGSLVAKSDARVCIVQCPEDVADDSTLITLATTFHRTMPETKKPIAFCEYKNDINYIIKNNMDDIIKRGLSNNSFKMFYQPIYSVNEKKYVAAEALIRLEDEKYGNISPALFIRVAELNGYIHDIGNFVTNNVIQFIASNDMEKLGLKYIQMNLSATQCIEVDLVDKIMNLLDEYGVDPSYLSLELTESTADINPVIVDMNVLKLHEAGIRFAIDDYGTGYSNIKRVTSLPIDQIKLDKSFVDAMDNPEMRIVIQDTINMLKCMGKEVLVEGVDRESIAKSFMELDADLIQGCELIQGFYFCEPLPERKFIEFIKKYA